MLTDCGLVNFDWDEWNQTERNEQCGARSESEKVKENESNNDIREAFRVFDRDGDRFISAQELGLTVNRGSRIEREDWT